MIKKAIHPTLVLPSARRCSRERHSQTVTPMAVINSTSAAAASPASTNITPMLTAMTGSSSKPHPHPPGLYTEDCRHRLIATPPSSLSTTVRWPVNRNDLIEFRFDPPFLGLKVKRHLSAQPITIRQAKITAKTEVGVRPSRDVFPKTICPIRSARNPGLLGEAILRNAHRDKKFLFEKLTRSHRRQQIGRSLITCDNRRFRHSKPSPVSTQNRPDSAQADAILTGTSPSKLQAVARWNAEDHQAKHKPVVGESSSTQHA